MICPLLGDIFVPLKSIILMQGVFEIEIQTYTSLQLKMLHIIKQARNNSNTKVYNSSLSTSYSEWSALI